MNIPDSMNRLLKLDDISKVIDTLKHDAPKAENVIVICEFPNPDDKDVTSDIKWFHTEMSLEHFLFLVGRVNYMMMGKGLEEIEESDLDDGEDRGDTPS